MWNFQIYRYKIKYTTKLIHFMISKFLKNSVLVFGVLCLVITNVSAQEFVNILNEDYYGFEVTSGDDGWWMQQPDNLSIVNNKGANGSSHSLKYTNAETFTGSKKAFGSTTISDMLIGLEPGTYDMKAMVWVEAGAQISNVRVNFRTVGFGDVNTVFDLSSIAKDQWVEVTAQLNIVNAFVNTNVRIMFDSSATSIGTMYLDNLVILDEAPPVIEEIPLSAKVVTVDDKNLSLEKGNYDISLKVWVDEKATMKSFYTYIVDPWVATKWEIDEVVKGEWIELTSKIVLESPAENSEFQIKVNNNPDYGGGKGVFYVDDINLVKTKNLYEDTDNFTIQITGETCPGKNNGKIKITSKHPENYIVSFNGNIYNFIDELVIENIEPNTYELCVSVEYTSFESCFTFEIESGNTLSGKISNVKSKMASVKINRGTAPFAVSVNGNEVLSTDSLEFDVAVVSGDVLEVKSDKDCEGLFVKNINMIKEVEIYPNPVSQNLNIFSASTSDIKIYNVLGEMVYSKIDAPKTHKISVYNMVAGIYFVKIMSNSQIILRKIIVK